MNYNFIFEHLFNNSSGKRNDLERVISKEEIDNLVLNGNIIFNGNEYKVTKKSIEIYNCFYREPSLFQKSLGLFAHYFFKL